MLSCSSSSTREVKDGIGGAVELLNIEEEGEAAACFPLSDDLSVIGSSDFGVLGTILRRRFERNALSIF